MNKLKLKILLSILIPTALFSSVYGNVIEFNNDSNGNEVTSLKGYSQSESTVLEFSYYDLLNQILFLLGSITASFFLSDYLASRQLVLNKTFKFKNYFIKNLLNLEYSKFYYKLINQH